MGGLAPQEAGVTNPSHLFGMEEVAKLRERLQFRKEVCNVIDYNVGRDSDVGKVIGKLRLDLIKNEQT